MAGRVPVQTCSSSVSGTWKAPSTVRVSPAVDAEDRGGDAVLVGEGRELLLPAWDDRDERAGGGLAEQAP